MVLRSLSCGKISPDSNDIYYIKLVLHLVFTFIVIKRWHIIYVCTQQPFVKSNLIMYEQNY